MYNIYSELQERKEILFKYRQEVIRRLNKLKYKGNPEYHIRFCAKRNQMYLVKKEENIRVSYLAQEKKLAASQIATYDYLQEIIRRIDKEIKAIDKSMKILNVKSPESYYETLCYPRQSLITPIVPTDEQFVEKWLWKIRRKRRKRVLH